jgi:predicted AlkP superfamily phosphohydrolase/phosphomutase
MILKKIFVLGLDCATPQLVFDEYLDHLPTISSLLAKGTFGLLESTVPPVTVPAWPAMMTGLDPGQMGIFGFTDRSDYTYRDNYIISFKCLHEMTVWDYLSEYDLTSIILNLPLTYPPKPLNGIMISSFLTPDKELPFTYPKEIKEEINTITGEHYIIDVGNFRTPDKKELLKELYNMTKCRFRIIKNFIQHKPWDFFVAVEMGIDRMQHAFWSYCFSDHEMFQKGNEFESALLEYYKFIDTELASIIELFDDETELLIVSDHGAKTLKGTFCINDWLIEKGYLKMKEKINTKTNFEMKDVDWEKTSVWGGGGYYGKLYFNVNTREPQGTIEPQDLEAFKNKIIGELRTLSGLDGETIESDFFDTSEIYHELNGVPPDLIFYAGHLDWRVTSAVGCDTQFMKESTAIDNSNHDKNGIFIHSSNPKSALNIDASSITKPELGELKQYSIIDIAPTVLHKFKIPLPSRLKGNIIC